MSCWIDLLGMPKTKPVPMWDFEAAVSRQGAAVRRPLRSPSCRSFGPADPDQIMIPDLDAVYICPWDPTQAWHVRRSLLAGCKPYNLCPRMALKRQVAEAAEAGYRPMSGVEPEFIVMRYDEERYAGEGIRQRSGDAQRPVRPGRQAWGYDVEATADSMQFLGDLIDILGELDWDLHDVVCEGAYSQFELDFGYTHAVEMADRLTFLRVLLKEVAKNYGMFVTYMPKVTIGDWRSGAHINFSIQDTKTGENIFGNSKDGWSDEVNHAVGGSACAMAADCRRSPAPRSRPTRALSPACPGFEGGVYTWAPTHVTYGPNNRSAMLRLPQNRYCIENRAVRHVHEHLSGARLHHRGRRPRPDREDRSGPAARQGPLPDDGAGVRRCRCPAPAAHAPGGGRTCSRRDDVMRAAMGEQLHKSYCAYKDDEWERYSVSISEWEVEEYLRFY